MGLVFVLLLGEIDLSAGVAGGVAARRHRAHASSTTAGRGGSRCSPRVVTGAVIGLVIGVLVSQLGIPSFVVTLAFFLGLQGVTLQADRRRWLGSGVNDPVLRGIAIKQRARHRRLDRRGRDRRRLRRPDAAARTARQSAKGLQHAPIGAGRDHVSSSSAVVVLGLTALLNANRAPNPPPRSPASRGSCRSSIALLIFWTFVLTRTRFGRHIYAVGGNAEAARRAGINVRRIRISAFVICSSMAAIAGILSRVLHRQGLRRARAAATSCCTPSARRSSAAPASSVARAGPSTPSSVAW